MLKSEKVKYTTVTPINMNGLTMNPVAYDGPINKEMAPKKYHS